jgi:hypothetical protein
MVVVARENGDVLASLMPAVCFVIPSHANST